MNGQDIRLAVPAAAAWIAVIVVLGMPRVAVPVVVVLWVLAGALSALWIVRARARSAREWLPIAALTLAAAALAVTAVAAGTTARSPPVLVEAAESGRHVTVVAELTQTVGAATDQFDATILSVAETPVRTPVVVFGAVSEARLPLGAKITLSGTLAAADAGDHASFLFFARAAPTVVAAPPGWLDWADTLRAGFLRVTQTLPGDGGALLAGLAIGDTSEVDDRLDGAMKQSSLSHLTAVSGANCAIVVGLIMVVGAAVGLPRWARVSAAVVALVGFVVLVTPEPSVLRAAVMAGIVLAALASGRPVRGLPVLSAATIVLLVLDPWLAREFGFALSVLATAGLLVLAGPVTGALARFLPRWLAAAIALPAAAQLACQPVLVLLDASIPTYGIVANLLAAPAAPVATIAGLASCLLAAVIPPLATALAWLAWLPSTWIAGAATFFADLPLARIPWPEGEFGASLLAVLSALGIAALFARERLRRWMTLTLCIALAAYTGVVGGGAALGRLGRPDWQIAACDVGQGDAFVVRSAGRTALIDTGPDAALLSACLSDLGITRIDLLVVSHYDLDHVGGMAAVTGRVESALVGPTATPRDEAVLRELGGGGASIQNVADGARGVLGELAWRVLWPPQKLGGIEPGNDASLVVEFRATGACTAGCLSSLFLGDLGEESQARVLGSAAISPVDVVKVSHHGSADQDPSLYLAARATVGLIGVGENDYGHPNRTLLDMLERAGTTAARTDTDGLILVAPGETPGSVVVWTER